MRRLALLLLPAAVACAAPAAASAAATAGLASVRVAECTPALEPEARTATFEARDARRARDRPARRALHAADPREGRAGWRKVAAPGFDAWLTSDHGVGRYGYLKTIRNLSAPASYRTVVRFRWLDAGGRASPHRQAHLRDLPPDRPAPGPRGRAGSSSTRREPGRPPLRRLREEHGADAPRPPRSRSASAPPAPLRGRCLRCEPGATRPIAFTAPPAPPGRRSWSPSTPRTPSTRRTRRTTCSSCPARRRRLRPDGRSRPPGARRASDALRERYAEAFRAWLEHRDERELGTAYALGREAVSAQLSVLDLAEMHHDAAAAALAAEPDPARAAELIAAASTFLGEALSTFEIAHRGYHEVQELARLEHEHVEQLRALAAASVRINAALTTEEALQLSADAAQQVLGVRRARISSTTGDPFARALSATSPPGGSPAETGAADRRDAAQRRPAARHARGRRRPRARVHAARRGDPRAARPGRLGGHRQDRGLHARAPHRAGAAALAAPGRPPDIPGIAAAVRFIAAGEGIEVGGDFYDLFGIDDGRRRGADRRRLRQGAGGRVGHRARAPHAARRGGLRAAAQRGAHAPAPRAARGPQRRPLLHGRLRGAAPVARRRRA